MAWLGVPVHVGVCVCSVAAQEEGVAGCSSQTVAQPADARTVFQGAAFAHVALRDRRGVKAGAEKVSLAPADLRSAPEISCSGSRNHQSGSNSGNVSR